MTDPNNNTSSYETLNLVPVKKERHVILYENIALALTPFSLKLYLIFRYESDYRSECSAINKKVKFFMNKSGMSRGKFFECMNELEEHGLIKRESKKGEQSKYWIADTYGYFTDKKEKKIQEDNEIDQQPVQNMDGVVQNLDGVVQQVDTIINNSFNNVSHIKPIVDSSKSTSYKDDDLFMQFYSVYPNKQKPEIARKAFHKHKPTQDFVSMLCTDIASRVENNWKNRHKNKIPHPATYLNGKEWEGEIVEPETKISISPKTNPKYDDNDTSWIEGVFP